MRLSVEHRTTVRFPAPRACLVQRLRVTPADTHDQTVASWRIDVDRDARLRDGRDGFGNGVTMLYVNGPVDAITVTVVGEVVTSHSDGVLHGAVETLPPALYCRAAALPAVDADLVTIAHAAREGDPLSALHRLNGAIHDRLADGATSPALADLFVALARTIGVPARHVGGYALGAAPGAAHGWAEAHVEGIGWIGFDPGTGRCPEDEYVRVAIGLDAAGAAPMARWGPLGEGLDVDVEVSVVSQD